MYCYKPTPGDIEFQRARYEAETDTIRSVPENYCLVAFTDDGPRYDVDAATADENDSSPDKCKWRMICQRAHRHYLSYYNKPGTEYGKRWLAWLISEWRKYGVD